MIGCTSRINISINCRQLNPNIDQFFYFLFSVQFILRSHSVSKRINLSGLQRILSGTQRRDIDEKQ